MTFDAIIVGAGGSGLAAAVSAAENGARVVVLEKLDKPGGTTGLAVGSFTANRTSQQERAGISDTLESHVEDAAKFAPDEIESRNNDEMRSFFLTHAGKTLAWLGKMGLVFQGPVEEPPNRVARMHNVVPGARAYISTLTARLKKLGGELICGASVTSLLQSAEGKVEGVIAEIGGERTEIRARRGVVLAAGDYANSRELIVRHKGKEFGEIEGINPNATGEGQVLVENAGGRLVNMDVTYGPELRFVVPDRKSWVELLPHAGLGGKLLKWLMPLAPNFVIRAASKRIVVTWQHPEDSLFEDGAILVNREGRRFCKETSCPDREIAVSQQPGKAAYLLMDDRLIDRYSAWPHFISTAPQIAYAYAKDYLRLRPDISFQGSLDEVARELGADAGELERTARDSGLAGDRWLLLGPAKAYFTITEGGARINERFQVLNDSDEPIPGLYAIGQNGLSGQILWGHGLHIGWAMTSGRLVGKEISVDPR